MPSVLPLTVLADIATKRSRRESTRADPGGWLCGLSGAMPGQADGTRAPPQCTAGMTWEACSAHPAARRSGTDLSLSWPGCGQALRDLRCGRFGSAPCRIRPAGRKPDRPTVWRWGQRSPERRWSGEIRAPLLQREPFVHPGVRSSPSVFARSGAVVRSIRNSEFQIPMMQSCPSGSALSTVWNSEFHMWWFGRGQGGGGGRRGRLRFGVSVPVPWAAA